MSNMIYLGEFKKKNINKVRRRGKNVQTRNFFCGEWWIHWIVEIARKMFIKHFKPMRCKECVIVPFLESIVYHKFFTLGFFLNASIMLLFISFFFDK